MFEAFGTDSPAGADAVSSLNLDPSPACGRVAPARPANRRLTGGPPVRCPIKPKGSIESTMTTVSPHARFDLTERASASPAAARATGASAGG